MNKSLKIIAYLVAGVMLSTSIIYFVTGYQQLTDETGSGFHEMAGDKNELPADSDLDAHQWAELELAGKVQTVFFITIGLLYIPTGIWMVKNRESKKPYLIALGGSLSLIILYMLSRIINLPLVGLQTDVGPIDVASKVLQGAIVMGCFYFLVLRRKLENSLGTNSR